MKPAEAKQQAYFHAGLALEGLLASGWEGLDDSYGEGDGDMIRAELTRLAADLVRRGGGS